ncbi:ABC transporter permease [Phenylobacterium sp.]|uniref:ABC transporter permease n=1 Tax=Phenylobacterium sp. TaxID=1871053 RepID=UPI003BADB7E8
MKYLWLLWAGLWRKPVRTCLLLLSVANAFLLFGLLEGFAGGVAAAQSRVDATLLVTGNRMGLAQPLPVAYAERIRSLPGVVKVSPLVSLQGSYQDPSNPVRAFAIDSVQMGFGPTFHIAPAQLARFNATRSGAIVSEELARTYGWAVGDRVPINSRLWTNRDGTAIWPVDIVGTYRSENALLVGAMLLQYDYLDAGRSRGRGMVNSLLVRIGDPADADRVAVGIDAAFANAAPETKTSSQQQIARDTVKSIGDVGVIVRGVTAAVFFALLLSVGAVMLQAGRERRTEIGVLKALGFKRHVILGLFLGEAVLTCGLAAAPGLLLASVLLPIVGRAMKLPMVQGESALAIGMLLALAIGLATGLPPAAAAVRLRAVTALSGR